jgi:hypothetical protein
MREWEEILNGSKRHYVHQFNAFHLKMEYTKFILNIQTNRKFKRDK